MGWFTRSLSSSIGKKFLMALTGSFLLIFLIVHLFGNLFLFWGGEGEAFNTYAETLRGVPYILIIEIILFALFILHAIYGVTVWFENRKAKSKKYAVNAKSENSSVFSRTMFISGSVIFIFLVIHLRDFWFAGVFGGHEESLYEIVVQAFSSPIYSGFYIIAMILLFYHLNHAFQSAFQTFGWNHSKYFPLIKTVGTIYAIVMGIGFISFPVYFLFFYGGA